LKRVERKEEWKEKGEGKIERGVKEEGKRKARGRKKKDRGKGIGRSPLNQAEPIRDYSIPSLHPELSRLRRGKPSEGSILTPEITGRKLQRGTGMGEI
jgi:hypothetical protein